MSTDKPGHELDDDAMIWEMYLEEANECDQELVKARQIGLDVLLLLAALFSAILTAFLVESKDLLKQDPADVSASLLLRIAQSQYRMELGLPPAENEHTPSIPDFVPSTSARWINGIWFTSLGLSLSAALTAMLSKEWLNAFISSRPRAAHAHVLLRQSRLEGLEKWWVLHIIALLPSILHVSLLLFGIGLVVYLWTLDRVVAAIFAPFLGITSLFYLLTTLLGICYEFCPFMTQLSGYIRHAITNLFNQTRIHQGQGSSKHPTLKDMEAILWLANNARNPAVVECSYQALAGLYQPIDANSDTENSNKPCMTGHLGGGNTLKPLLAVVVSRFEQCTVSLIHLNCDPEMPINRYLHAIMALASHIRYLPGDDQRVNLCQCTPEEDTMHSEPHTGYSIIASQFLKTTMSLWRHDGLGFSANICASLLVAEMEIMQLVEKPRQLNDGSNHLQLLGNQPTPATPDHVAIPLVPLGPNSFLATGQKELTDYCHLWPARVSILLSLHARNQITVETTHLKDLLCSLNQAASCDVLNPPEFASAHYTHNQEHTRQNYCSPGLVTDAGSIMMQSDSQYSEPLGSLVRLLDNRLIPHEVPLVQMCLCALNAYSAWAPIVLQQALGFDRTELRDAFDINKLCQGAVIDIAGVRNIAMRQALLTIRFMGISETTDSNHFKLVEDVFSLMANCLSQDRASGSEVGSHIVLAQHSDELVPILQFVGASDSNMSLLSTSSIRHLINLARFRVAEWDVTPCQYSLTPKCFPPLIRMIGLGGLSSKEAEEMLQAMIGRMLLGDDHFRQKPNVIWSKVPAIDYLRCFIHEALGFSSLAIIGSQEKYEKAVVAAVVEITNLAAGHHPGLAINRVELVSSAVPGFLAALILVAQYYSKTLEDQGTFVDFSNNAIDLLEAASEDVTSKKLMSKSRAMQNLWGALHLISENPTAQDVAGRLYKVGQGTEVEFTELANGPETLEAYRMATNEGEKLEEDAIPLDSE
ncbi:hypothetical protein FRC07_004348 [Ceratobasidium sp. 392]|nr:hypothetical protein FRC07_004348 [Ceratobasidium sp. 392]